MISHRTFLAVHLYLFGYGRCPCGTASLSVRAAEICFSVTAVQSQNVTTHLQFPAVEQQFTWFNWLKTSSVSELNESVNR